MKIEDRESNDIPAWYELSYTGEGKVLIHVHHKALKEIMAREWDKVPMVPLLTSLLKLSLFTPPQEGSWGFGKILVPRQNTQPGWLTWGFPLPNIRGSESPQAQLDIRATLYMMFSSLWLCEIDTGWTSPQLMIVENVCLPTADRSFGNGSISVTLTPTVVHWIRQQPENSTLLPVVEALKHADATMWPGSNHDGHRFGAICRKPKRIHLDVPGNACGLDPESDLREAGDEGYTLHPHNVDSGLQQLTFLAGLARLHDLIRNGK